MFIQPINIIIGIVDEQKRQENVITVVPTVERGLHCV